jgi:hypothetical protein
MCEHVQTRDVRLSLSVEDALTDEANDLILQSFVDHGARSIAGGRRRRSPIDRDGARATTPTTGTRLCADGQILRRRPNIGAVGVARQHGRLTTGPSGQLCRRRRPVRPDGMPSA